MNSHWWRNTRPKVDEENERTWPKLTHPAVEERSHAESIQRPRFSRLSLDLASGSEVSDLQEGLNEFDYPKLGEVVLRRKHSVVDDSRVEGRGEPASTEPRRSRVPRSTDTIHINLHKTLESLQTRIWPIRLQTEQSTRITVDLCKLNVNMSVSAPPECRWPVPKSQHCVGFVGKKKKKPSRNKLLIHCARLMRMMKSEYELTERQITDGRDGDGGIDGIDFNRLGINTVPPDDPELVRKMAALSCLNTDYRSTRQVKMSEDTVVFRPDVHEKMDNLSLGDGDDCRFEECANEITKDAEAVDCDAMEATLSLGVCDETGEFKDGIPIKREPGRIRFSKKFREYCTNTLTPELRKHVEEFLAEIARLQRRMYGRDSVKGKSKRRYYAGIKEVQKHIDLKKIKFVVIAPDLEKVEMEGGLDDTLNMLLGACKRHEVPYCFALGRRKLGYYTHGNGFASCIGISNYSGAEEKLKNVLSAIVEARNEFARLIDDEPRTIDSAKLLPKEELILSEVINAYSRILASSG